MGGTPEQHHVGMRNFGVWDPATNQRFDFSVWYPSVNEGAPKVREGWNVLNGAYRRIQPGFYPVVLVSHDTASSRFANNDLSSALAAAGMIVIVPTHAGDSQRLGADIFSADSVMQRPRQLLYALDTVLGTPDFAPCADESRIGLLGVGSGAITVLQLAGAVPDFSRVAGYCSNASPEDAFCSGWTEKRLAAIPSVLGKVRNVSAAPAKPAPAKPVAAGGKQKQTKKQGKKPEAAKGPSQNELRSKLNPPLTAYAPELVAAEPVFPAENRVEDTQKPESKRNVSLWDFLFGQKNTPEEQERAAAALREEKQAALNASLSMAFNEMSLFGEKEQGVSFLYIELPESFEPAPPEPEKAAGADGAGKKGQKGQVRTADPRVTAFRRDPTMRRIRAIGLMAPAGGMLFSQDSLRGVVAPVAVVEAQKDGLYPPSGHAAALYTALRVPPLVLQLPGVDHFSLFARCSRDNMTELGAICGKLSGPARKDVSDQRDRFFVSFFQSALGGALEPALPSGYVAREVEQ